VSDALSLAEATAQLTAPGQVFETVGADVGGVAMTVWKHAPVSLRHVFDLSLNHAERDFVVYEDQRLTFDAHYRLASTLAHRLREHGVASGDRVVIAARNLPQWVVTFWATICAGAIVVPLNAWWTSDELRYGVVDSGATVLVVDEERLERLRPSLDELEFVSLVLVIPDQSGRAANTGDPHPRVRIEDFASFVGDAAGDATPPAADLQPDDDAAIFYTSGTTGHPKGAVATHRNIATNLMSLFFIGSRASLRFGASEDGPSSFLLSIPLFHATGCLAVMVVNTAAGGKLVLMHHFDAARALELIATEQITNIGGVPSVAMQIVDHPSLADYDTSSVRSVSYGGAPAPPDLVRRIRAVFPRAQPGNGYGLTETSAAVALNTGADYVERPESCGTPVPVCEVAIVPEEFAGDEPPAGADPDAVGELWIKGPNVVRGYWHKPEATAASFSRGWLRTGDIARRDADGFLYIVDRAKDMIIRGGENVSSVAVESAIFEHPDVEDCAVVGLPHPVLGEEVCAVIVLRSGRPIEAEEITRHVAARLARYEVPTRVFFRATPLPRNPQGKVLKRELRAGLTEGSAPA